MADFFSSGWSSYIIIATILSVLYCFLLAFLTSRAQTPVPEDGVVKITGHVWDETLCELNNPLPKWWLYLFYITCVFSVAYLFLYPGLGTYSGSLKWSSTGQYELEVEQVDEVTAPLFSEYLSQEIPDVAKNPEAVAMGERLFLTYCSQCHGSDARGSRSFPNLTDGDWLGAGDPAYIKNTIMTGRTAVMPAMAAAVGGSGDDVDAVAHYIMSLSESRHDAILAAKGRPKFAVCAACHGADGTGNPVLGAPNLTDDTWLHGASIHSVKQAINNGFSNRMPPFGELLGEGKAHVLASYIWSLSHSGEESSATQ